MRRHTFMLSIYWKTQCLEQFEIKIDVPDDSEDYTQELALTMLGVETDIRNGSLTMEWKELTVDTV